ncbi:MAG TPA: hypothetical protein VFK47_20770 [Ktedonobacteraceae bacterium]|nr:hypothetical protein [Ktedonobacteraceae bacterium]
MFEHAEQRIYEHEHTDFYPKVDEVFQDETAEKYVIPVCIEDVVRVQELPRKSAGFQGFPLATGTAVKVLERDPRRASAVIVASGNPVALGGQQQVALGSQAFILPVGVLLTVRDFNEMWATSTTGNATLSIMNEQWSY